MAGPGLAATGKKSRGVRMSGTRAVGSVVQRP
ncbi:hypothetical protein E2C01_071773 [Portunus trituberculatus]|uniref:Uncharacterized protein n=1 Tax=Portunus trituberculatus TaxID=210409 RepID=A0A5B7HW56_PORTR|nr:hypothetical protein [Portunus trituberculatus]